MECLIALISECLGTSKIISFFISDSLTENISPPTLRWIIPIYDFNISI